MKKWYVDKMDFPIHCEDERECKKLEGFLNQLEEIGKEIEAICFVKKNSVSTCVIVSSEKI